ncbi:hypothetical protein C8R45DRAFT_92313 [Mycena sanguinolenta]|nr:hypothetical protein C8R45DRAFT_92313 [Mycena sanguinolenta]
MMPRHRLSSFILLVVLERWRTRGKEGGFCVGQPSTNCRFRVPWQRQRDLVLVQDRRSRRRYESKFNLIFVKPQLGLSLRDVPCYISSASFSSSFNGSNPGPLGIGARWLLTHSATAVWLGDIHILPLDESLLNPASSTPISIPPCSNLRGSDSSVVMCSIFGQDPAPCRRFFFFWNRFKFAPFSSLFRVRSSEMHDDRKLADGVFRTHPADGDDTIRSAVPLALILDAFGELKPPPKKNSTTYKSTPLSCLALIFFSGS